MLVIKLGKGEVSFEGSVTVSNVIGYLKENPEKARELGVQGQLSDTIVADFNGSLIDLSAVISIEGDLKLLGPGSDLNLKKF
jgi:hypothetical protein